MRKKPTHEDFVRLCKKHGLQENCTREDVKVVRKKGARELHPDLQRNEEDKLVANALSAEINADCDYLFAYLELQTPLKRAPAPFKAASPRHATQPDYVAQWREREEERLRKQREREVEERNKAQYQMKFGDIYLADPEFMAMYKEHLEWCMEKRPPIEEAREHWILLFREYKWRLEAKNLERAKRAEQERLRVERERAVLKAEQEAEQKARRAKEEARQVQREAELEAQRKAVEREQERRKLSDDILAYQVELDLQEKSPSILSASDAKSILSQIKESKNGLATSADTKTLRCVLKLRCQILELRCQAAKKLSVSLLNAARSQQNILAEKSGTKAKGGATIGAVIGGTLGLFGGVPGVLFGAALGGALGAGASGGTENEETERQAAQNKIKDLEEEIQTLSSTTAESEAIQKSLEAVKNGAEKL